MILGSKRRKIIALFIAAISSATAITIATLGPASARVPDDDIPLGSMSTTAHNSYLTLTFDTMAARPSNVHGATLTPVSPYYVYSSAWCVAKSPANWVKVTPVSLNDVTTSSNLVNTKQQSWAVRQQAQRIADGSGKKAGDVIVSTATCQAYKGDTKMGSPVKLTNNVKVSSATQAFPL